MGVARRRGTFEERKVGAIARQKVEAKQEAIRRAEIKANETPKQKLKRHQARMELMMLLGMGGAYHFPYLSTNKKKK